MHIASVVVAVVTVATVAVVVIVTAAVVVVGLVIGIIFKACFDCHNGDGL